MRIDFFAHQIYQLLEILIEVFHSIKPALDNFPLSYLRRSS